MQQRFEAAPLRPCVRFAALCKHAYRPLGPLRGKCVTGVWSNAPTNGISDEVQAEYAENAGSTSRNTGCITAASVSLRNTLLQY